MKELRLKKGFVALVDDEDHPRLTKYNWYKTTRGYAARSLEDGSRWFLHNEIMNAIGIDHIDGDKLNNQKKNLRIANQSINKQNSKQASLSGFKGVCESSGGRWTAAIRKDYKAISLGTYDTKEEAAHAYDRAAIALFGEHCMTNFPKEIYATH